MQSVPLQIDFFHTLANLEELQNEEGREKESYEEQIEDLKAKCKEKQEIVNRSRYVLLSTANTIANDFFGVSLVTEQTEADLHVYRTVADPDLQIRGGGGGGHPGPEIRGGTGLPKNFFWPFRPHFGRKMRGEPGPPGPSPGSATAEINVRSSQERRWDGILDHGKKTNDDRSDITFTHY